MLESWCSMDQRLELLVGESNLNNIKKLNVLVLGIGGVGGYVCEGLVRSFINSITIVDKDIIDISNINRQIIATTSTVGLNKVDVMEKRINDINPSVKVNKFNLLINERSLEEIFSKEYDYVVDCIDDVKAKMAVIKYCSENNINLIVSTGTGNKLDPSKLYITTLDKTSYDPLAKVLRVNLKKQGVNSKVVCLSSKEEPIKNDAGVIASNAFVPSSAGLLITSYIINCVINKNKQIS